MFAARVACFGGECERSFAAPSFPLVVRCMCQHSTLNSVVCTDLHPKASSFASSLIVTERKRRFLLNLASRQCLPALFCGSKIFYLLFGCRRHSLLESFVVGNVHSKVIAQHIFRIK